MRRSTHRRHRWVPCAVFGVIVFMLAGHPSEIGRARGADDDRPELSLRATPTVGFVPLDVLFVGQLRGGADDFEDLYCVTVEWDWDDDTRSASTPDCEPYEPGSSEIRRRYSTRHRFHYGGRYEIRLNLKRRDDVVASARTVIEIRGDGRFR